MYWLLILLLVYVLPCQPRLFGLKNKRLVLLLCTVIGKKVVLCAGIGQGIIIKYYIGRREGGPTQLLIIYFLTNNVTCVLVMISYNEFNNSYKLDGHMIVEFDNSLFFVHQGDILLQFLN